MLLSTSLQQLNIQPLSSSLEVLLNLAHHVHVIMVHLIIRGGGASEQSY